jgi:hypothetical protein
MSDSSKKGHRVPSLESESDLMVLPLRGKPGEEQRILDQQKGEKRFSVVDVCSKASHCDVSYSRTSTPIFKWNKVILPNQDMIYLIPTVGLLKVRALLSPQLPFLPCQDREKRSQVFKVSYLDPMPGELAYHASTAVVDVIAGLVHVLAEPYAMVLSSSYLHLHLH